MVKYESARAGRGFTLVELLVVISVTGLLMGILLPVLGRARQKGRSLVCASHMRQIAAASIMYVQDHDGLFAKSSHSAAATRCLRWGPAFMPYLGYGRFVDLNDASWEKLFKGLYRCPSDMRKKKLEWSYGKNVWFELRSIETAEALELPSGGPTYWAITRVRRPALTIEFGELLGTSAEDHFMAHFWLMGGEPEIDNERHGRLLNFSYLDGHVHARLFKETFDVSEPQEIVDNWNPGSARE